MRWGWRGSVAGVCLLVLSLPDAPVAAATPVLAERSPGFASDHILVKFKPGAGKKAAESSQSLQKTPVNQQFDTLGVREVSVEKDRVREQVEAYRNDPDVLYAEPDYTVTADSTPDDPGFADQWGLAAIQAPAAWDITTGSSAIRIAVLDTGIDQDHEDLSSKIVANQNFTSAADYDDHYGHGTHVAGIAAAITDNGLGVAGVGYNASLMNVKVLDDDGQGLDSWVASGITWAADNGASVINLSLGGTEYSAVLADAVSYAWNHGVVVVAAAGNEGSSIPEYPADDADCLAVTATDQNDALASFANFGTWVALAAPGVEIYSTLPNHSHTEGTTNYGYLEGTSMAAPFVSGLAALVWSTRYGTGNSAVVNRIESTADAVSGTGTKFQYGRIDAARAVGAPSVSTETASGISGTAATLNGRLSDTGSATAVAVSFDWGTASGGPYSAATTARSMAAAGDFSAPLTGLTAGKTYYYRAKAAGAATVYGDEKSFTAASVTPGVTTAEASDVGSAEATLNGTLDSLGSEAAVQVGFVWGTTSGGPYPNSILESSLSAAGSFSSGLTGLSADTDYYFRAEAVGSAAVYGDEKHFHTSALQYSLTVTDDGDGSVQLSPDQTAYAAGAAVQLTAAAASGWTFSGWNGDLTGAANPASLTMDGNKTVTAIFQKDSYILTVVIDGQGSVSRSPEEGSYSAGESIQLTATAADGWTFSSWQGVDSASGNTAAVTIEGNQTVTAVFVEQTTAPAAVPSSGGGGGGGGGTWSPPPVTIKLSGFSGRTILTVSSAGSTAAGFTLTTADGQATLAVAAGTTLRNSRGEVLTSLSAAALSQDPPADKLIILGYSIGPRDAVFNPLLTLTLTYGAQSLPSGVSAAGLYPCRLDDQSWVRLASETGTKDGTVSIKIGQSGSYALLADLPAPAPANFHLDSLIVSPAEVTPGSPVTIQAGLANTGGTSGEYLAVLRVNGVKAVSQTVFLGAGQDRIISFQLSENAVGEYQVDLNGLAGAFKVAAPMKAFIATTADSSTPANIAAAPLPAASVTAPAASQSSSISVPVFIKRAITGIVLFAGVILGGLALLRRRKPV